MIHHISIRNFAIIENTEIDFENGLNIITGETGSGKSIVIEAVSLALGSRADSSYVRTGADKAYIQLAGELDGEEIVITREISAAGKNLCRLNGEIVTLAQLNQVSRRLADIHGQYDNQSLLNPDHHMVLVDAYRHDTTGPLKDAVKADFDRYAQVRSQLALVLRAVVSQQLIRTIDGENVPVFEVMVVNPAIQNMIRDGRTHMIENAIYSSRDPITIDGELQKLVRGGRITRETALSYAVNREMLEKMI